MALDPTEAYFAYSAAWNEGTNSAAREKLLESAWASDGEFFDEDTPEGLTGVQALSTYIAETHEQMPNLVISETADPVLLGNRLRVPWLARQGDTVMFTGTDFVEFAADGRVSRVTMFYDSTPD
ncbi:MAG TPA: hypothetical protein VMT88_12205 [Actinomycetes bacterium]|nr:hypothetical protein [Actinomycetes bacterium]